MKKLIIFGFAILLNSFLYGQNKLDIGIIIKPQVSSLMGRNDILGQKLEYRNAMVSLAGGLSLGYELNQWISIHSGIFYQPQGVKKEKIAVPGYIYFTTNIKYMRIPLAASINLTERNKLSINLSAGLGFNYLLKAEDNLREVVSFFVNTIIEETEGDRYNKCMLDSQISFEINYNLYKNLFLMGNLELIQGISRFHKEYSLGSNADINMKSRIFNMGLAIGMKCKL